MRAACFKGELNLPSEKSTLSTRKKSYSGLPPSRSLVSLNSSSKLPFLEVTSKFLFYMFFLFLFLRTAWSLFSQPSSILITFSSPQSLSQNIQTSNGVHSQHKQMNILQTITPNGGALQVIQAQTVQKSSSRRAITSTTSSYSSQFSSNFTSTNGGGHGSFSSGHPMNSDLLVRLINIALAIALIDLHLFHTHTHTWNDENLN